jgi:hypothetical protein
MYILPVCTASGDVTVNILPGSTATGERGGGNINYASLYGSKWRYNTYCDYCTDLLRSQNTGQSIFTAYCLSARHLVGQGVHSRLQGMVIVCTMLRIVGVHTGQFQAGRVCVLAGGTVPHLYSYMWIPVYSLSVCTVHLHTAYFLSAHLLARLQCMYTFPSSCPRRGARPDHGF